MAGRATHRLTQLGRGPASLAAALALLSVPACKKDEPQPSTQELVTSARSLTGDYQQQLKAALSEAMKSGGPAHAIAVCNQKAPAIESRISSEGWTIHRTAERVRNPKNRPSAWQKKILADFADQIATGPDDSQPIEWHEVRDGNFRYMRAIVTAPLCVTCHGENEQIAPAVKEELSKLYPSDEATGFSAGDLRGAFVVERPLD